MLDSAREFTFAGSSPWTSTDWAILSRVLTTGTSVGAGASVATAASVGAAIAVGGTTSATGAATGAAVQLASRVTSSMPAKCLVIQFLVIHFS